MRGCRHVNVVRARQHGGGSGKYDVVAVSEEACEAAVAFSRFGRRKICEPRVRQPHFATVGRMAEARQPGSLVRATDRDDTVHTGIGIEFRKPCADRNTPHAVTHEHQRLPRSRFYPRRSCLDVIGVAVDRAENRLEVDCDEGNVARPELMHPGIPQTAIANEAMHQKHAPPAVRPRGQ